MRAYYILEWRPVDRLRHSLVEPSLAIQKRIWGYLFIAWERSFDASEGCRRKDIELRQTKATIHCLGPIRYIGKGEVMYEVVRPQSSSANNWTKYTIQQTLQANIIFYELITWDSRVYSLWQMWISCDHISIQHSKSLLKIPDGLGYKRAVVDLREAMWACDGFARCSGSSG